MNKSKETTKKKKTPKKEITFNKQRITIAVLVLIILLSVASTIFFIVKSNRDNDKDSKDYVLTDTIISNLSINNSFIIGAGDGSSSFNATVTNTLNSDYQISELIATFTIGGEKVEAIILKDTTMKPNESRQVVATVDKDLSKLTAINYVVK